MQSRKHSLSLAKQYRTCPPAEIRKDPAQKDFLKQHLAICPYCSGPEAEAEGPWVDLTKGLSGVLPPTPQIRKTEEIMKGQLRYVRTALCSWWKGRFYNPPLVLVLEKPGIADNILVAQTYHDAILAGPGDLILSNAHTSIGELFVETWNIYSLRASDLNANLSQITPEVLWAVKTLEKTPDAYPEWAMVPRPFVENDARIYFRVLEVEVGYVFASQAVGDLVTKMERPRPKLAYTSPSQAVTDIKGADSSICWLREPSSVEEAFATAHFPADRLAFAASGREGKTTPVNIVVLRKGKLKEIKPGVAEIFMKTVDPGSFTISGRLQETPQGTGNCVLVSFLMIEKKGFLPPQSIDWDRETGDFFINFFLEDGTEGKLKLALLIEEE